MWLKRIPILLNDNNKSLSYTLTPNTQLTAWDLHNVLIMRIWAAGNYANFFNSSDESFLLTPEGKTSSGSVSCKSADSKSVTTTHLWRRQWLSLANYPNAPPHPEDQSASLVLSLRSLEQEMPFPVVWPCEGKFLNHGHYCVCLHPSRSSYGKWQEKCLHGQQVQVSLSVVLSYISVKSATRYSAKLWF